MKLQRILEGLARLLTGRKHSLLTPAISVRSGMPEVNEDGRIVLGYFSPSEFKSVRGRLECEGVEIEIECDTSAPPENDQGMFVDRRTIAILVHRDNFASASAIKSAWLAEIGHVEIVKAEPGATDNPGDA